MDTLLGDIFNGIAWKVILVGVGLWGLYCFSTISKYAAKDKNDPLSMKVDPTAILEVKQKNDTGCIGTVGGCLWWILVAGFLYFVVFYILPYIGPAVRTVRDLR